MECELCKKQFIQKTYNQRFCSERCRNNSGQKRWQNNHKKMCPKCHKNIIWNNSDVCVSCKTNKMVDRSTTIGEYHSLLSIVGKHPSWKNAHIRNLARDWHKELSEMPCKNCGYSLHVELCHIKPVSSFPEIATIGEVNSKDNLINLCRNCHWELDHGFLSIDSIGLRERT